MDIAILNYQTNKVKIISKCPDIWSIADVEDYLFKVLNYKKDEINYMCGGHIQYTEEEYSPRPKKHMIYDKWKELKSKHPDAVLLFRCGNFYETYSQDAEKTSKILGITLIRSSRYKDADGKSLIMAGFPHHALDTYLPKLISKGERIAICDQLEVPQKYIYR